MRHRGGYYLYVLRRNINGEQRGSIIIVMITTTSCRRIVNQPTEGLFRIAGKKNVMSSHD